MKLSAEREPKEDPQGLSGGGDPDMNLEAFSSRMIAAARARESGRADRLFGDPFAELLAGRDAMRASEDLETSQEAAGKSSGDSISSPSGDAASAAPNTNRRLAIRTRFIDDFFEDCVLSRGIKQVVSLGAGMDTRGLRLRATTGTVVFEVDQPAVLRVKNNLLAKEASCSGGKDETPGNSVRARVVGVEADLSQAGWKAELSDAGFNPSLPSAWILEGFTMYLDEQELVSLLGVLSKLCSPGSAFLATCVSSEAVARAQASGNGLLGSWKWGSDDPQEFFEATLPAEWCFQGVTCGTPGAFPDGADYSVGVKGKGSVYITGYLTKTELEPSSSEGEGPTKEKFRT